MAFAKKLKAAFAAVVATTVVGGGGYMYATSNISKGGRAGVVSKLSEREGGFFTPWCDSWEGTLNGLSPIEFSVTDPEIVKKLEDARKSGQMVDLKYIQKRNPSLYKCWADSAYIITGVEYMSDSPRNNGQNAPTPFMTQSSPAKVKK